MINLDDLIQRMKSDAEAMRVLIEPISVEQAGWKPDAQTWSIHQVMDHLYNEERLDFRTRQQEILSSPPQAWGALQGEYMPTQGSQQALMGFLAEREASIVWLLGLKSPDWNMTIEATFGPQNEKMVFSAGDILTSWVEHDFLHMRQVIELLHAWNTKQAAPYSVAYAGGW